MEYFRAHTPSDFAGHKVLAVRDYKADTVKDLATGEVKPYRTSILQCFSTYELEDNRMASASARLEPSEDQVLLRRERYLPGRRGSEIREGSESVMTIVNGLL